MNRAAPGVMPLTQLALPDHPVLALKLGQELFTLGPGVVALKLRAMLFPERRVVLALQLACYCGLHDGR